MKNNNQTIQSGGNWSTGKRKRKNPARVGKVTPLLFIVANNARAARSGSLGMKDVTRWIAHCVATAFVGPVDLLGPR